MDATTKNIADFLSAIQSASDELGDLVNEMRVRPGVIYAKPFLVLSASPFTVDRGGKVERYIGCLSVGASVRHSNGRVVSWALRSAQDIKVLEP